MASLTPWAPPHDPRRPPPPQRPLLGAIPSPSPCSSPTPWGDAAPLAHARRGGGGHGGDIMVGGGDITWPDDGFQQGDPPGQDLQPGLLPQEALEATGLGGGREQSKEGGGHTGAWPSGCQNLPGGVCVWWGGVPWPHGDAGGAPHPRGSRGVGAGSFGWVWGGLAGGAHSLRGGPVCAVPQNGDPTGVVGGHTRPHGARLPMGGGGPGWGGPQALPGSCAPPLYSP